MKILSINKYYYPRGGSENSFFEKNRLMEAKGHEVIPFSMTHPKNLPSKFEKYFISNIDYDAPGFLSAISASIKLLYSMEAYKKIESLIKETRPDIAHLHNIHHQISPSIIHCLRKNNIPIVMTLHDSKMVCPAYTLLSHGKLCDDCKGGAYYNCFRKVCVKNSRTKSLLNTIEMYLHHKLFHIYDHVDTFISPSIFLMDKAIEMGFKGKIVHISNFVNVGTYEPKYHWEENSIVYFGRLSEEKGLLSLVEVAKSFPCVNFKIIGDGPIRRQLEDRVAVLGLNNVNFLGHMTAELLNAEIQKSMFVVLPSESYENNPRSAIEAFALGKPVIGSRIGGIPELVRDGITGFTFESGNVDDLRSKIEHLLTAPNRISEMGKSARRAAEVELNADVHYEKLMKIYNRALASRKS